MVNIYQRIVFRMIGIALFVFLPSLIGAAEDPADSLARMVLDKAAMRATVCEMPQAGDGTLAAAFAKAGVAQVHALAPDANAVEAARKPTAASGVLGSQVIVETGSPGALPLGDWVADLYVVTDATDANLDSLSAAEAGRVLSPMPGSEDAGARQKFNAMAARLAQARQEAEAGPRAQRLGQAGQGACDGPPADKKRAQAIHHRTHGILQVWPPA